MVTPQVAKFFFITASLITLLLGSCSHRNSLLSVNPDKVAKVINDYEATANKKNNYKQNILICGAFYRGENNHPLSDYLDIKRYCQAYTEELAAFAQSQGFAHPAATDFQDKHVWVTYQNSPHYKPVTESEFAR